MPTGLFEKDFRALVTSQLVKNCLTLIVSLLVAKYLGVDERSLLAYYSSLGLLLSVVFLSGLPQLAAFDKESFDRNLLPIFIWISLPVSLVICYFAITSLDLSLKLCLLLCVYAFFLTTLIVVKEILRKQNNMSLVASIFVKEPFIVGSLSLGLLFLYPNAESIFVAQVSGTMFMALYSITKINFSSWHLSFRKPSLPLKNFSNYFRVNLSTGITLYGPVVLMTYLNIGAEYIAGFAMAQVFISQLEVFSNSKVFQLLPVMSEMESFSGSVAWEHFKGILILNFILICLVALGLWIVVLPILGDGYSMILPIFLILGLGVFMSGFIKASNVWFNLNGYSGYERVGTELRMVLMIIIFVTLYFYSGELLICFFAFPLSRFVRFLLTFRWLAKVNIAINNPIQPEKR